MKRLVPVPVPPAAPYANAPLAAHWAELWLPGFRGELVYAGNHPDGALVLEGLVLGVFVLGWALLAR